MTQRQKRFCEYYIKTLNATDSAKKAGYSKKTAYTIGQKLTKKDEIKKYIQQRLEKTDKKIIMSADRAMEEVTKIALGSATEEHIFIIRNKIERVEKRIFTKDQLKALEMILKLNGKFDVNIKELEKEKEKETIKEFIKSIKATDKSLNDLYKDDVEDEH